MSVTLNINGNDYFYPQTGDVAWGPDATDWAVAVTSGMLQKAGGLFQLLGEVDFGTSYGLKSVYYKSRSSNIASAGSLRLARTDVVSWRNQANSADLNLSVNSSDELQFNGLPVAFFTSVSDTATIDLTVSLDVLSADIKADSITNSMINSAAGIVYSKLSLSNSIVNADINASAAIAYSKLALTNSIVNADISSSAAIAYSKLNLSGSILNADINASAAIARTKLASGNAYRILANDASGVMSENAAITASRAVASDANGQLVAATTTATELGYVNGVTSAIQTQLNAKLALAGGTMSGAINMGSQGINTLLDPVNPQDAATKNYVDSVAQGLNVKPAVVVATTANITLSGEQTIDGVLTSASRVLVKDQSLSQNNGIYVSGAGGWSRAQDANTWAELISAFVFVSQGTTQADTGWVCTIDAGGTLGVTPVTWAQFSSAGIIVAGAGLTKTGNTLDVNVDNSTIEISGNNLRIKPLGVTASEIAALTITNAQISASAGITLTKLANITAGSILMGNASNIPTATALTGDVTINSSGVTAISSGVIVNGDIAADAAIAWSKMANLTNNRALVSNGSGDVSVATTTATELGYVNGVTSSIQTQLNTKMANPMTTGGDVIYGGASGTPTRLANGSAGQILQSNGTTLAPTWVTPAGGLTVTAVSSNITLAANNIYLVSTASARSLQLPAPVTGMFFYIKDSTGNAQTNNITLVRNASEQIEGIAASKVLQTGWGAWMIVTDGTNWFIV